MNKSDQKKRLDSLLVDRGLCPSRSKAQALILSGKVLVDGIVRDKPGTRFRQDCNIIIEKPLNPFVSRGGLKLEEALNHFSIDVREKVCIDVGASTGGFTHCLLMRGAQRVIAIDVGYGQLDWSLRNDPRVVVMERTNFRHVNPDSFPYKDNDLIVIDVSFISLKLILPVAKELLRPDGLIIALVKPQFEAGPQHVGKGGIVKDPNVHKMVVDEIIRFSSDQLALLPLGVVDSPILGAKGNKEFLLTLKVKTSCCR